MKKRHFRLNKNFLQIALVILSLIMGFSASPRQAAALQPPEPFVAIHVSELTQALETTPAIPPTPTGPGTTGKQWWYTSWHYFVANESLKEALRSDGTPFVEVSDSDIAAGRLRNADGSPHYPILISLASEAIDDSEISPLRDYVSAGGFLFVGSSAFTRYPDGSNRGDFALASEMGLHMTNANPTASNNWNWYQNLHFTKLFNHRLVAHIPNNTLTWSGPITAGEIPWGSMPSDVPPRPNWTWSVIASGAAVVANGDSGPLLVANNYGQGQFIFHGAMQPIIGHGATDPSTHAYFIYRKAIEWAFDSLAVPIVKLSPWRYPYDAALLIRHDLEVYTDRIKAIGSSAQFEHSLGAVGDYYFCTGALRTYTGTDKNAIISNLQNAVSLYGATIGSHNGGLGNPTVQPSDYYYWHWGPDEALDQNPPGYPNGKAFASASILASFLDIEGWLAGFNNGRSGCGATGTCPRTFVAPFFNATREDSKDILQQLGSINMGEEKIGPFPHFSLSYNVPGKHFSHVSLPASDWYVGTAIPEGVDNGHTWDSIRAAVDFYNDMGGLLNFYGHQPSNDGALEQEYVTYSMSKPRLWSTNTVGVHDWWLSRSNVVVTPTISTTGNTYLVKATISGATDADTAIELALPQISGQAIGNMSVYLNGTPATTSQYRTANYGVKVRVGSTTSNATVQYTLQASNSPPVAFNDAFSTRQNTPITIAAPGVLSNDTNPAGAPLTAQLVSGPSHGTLVLNADGSFSYTPNADYAGSDNFTYMANIGTATSNIATVIITVTSNNSILFSDDFTQSPTAPNPLSPWINTLGTWTVTNGVLQGSSTPSTYASIYTSTNPLWTDYSVEGRIQFPAGAFGGGLGGRVNPVNGARYGAWIYPDGSVAGANMLRLVKFRDWTTWNWTAMQQISLPSVGTGWHTLKMAFNGSRIQVYYDGTVMIDVTDNNYDSLAPYLSGGISADMWTNTNPYAMSVENVVVVNASAGALSSLSLNPASVTGGTNSQGTVTLSGPAPSGGAVVSLSSNTTSAATVPASVTIPSGSTSATFTITTTAVTSSIPVTISAVYGGVTKTATLAVNQASNLPPVAVNDAYSTNANTALNQTAPGVLNNDTDPQGATLTAQLVSGPSHGTLALNADGSFSYTPIATYVGSDKFTYMAKNGTTNSNIATVTITVLSTSGVLFSDDFTRSPTAPDPLSPWVNTLGTWTVTNGVLQGSSTPSTYASIYTSTNPLWSDYTVEGRLQFPAGAFGGGLGGRVNPANGARYGAWIYPDGSAAGSNMLRLVKFRDWTTWNWTAMQQISLPSVGTGWHTLKMAFIGSRIQVYYDGTLMIDTTDNNYDSLAPYLSGGISADLWTYTAPYAMSVENIVVVNTSQPGL